MNAYTHLLRPLLFQLPADRAHALAHTALSCAPPWDLLGRSLSKRPVPLVANVCGFAVDELAEATTDLQPYVDAVEIGLICPHAGDQGGLGTLQTFAALVEALTAVRRVPVLMKLPPHHTPD